MTIRNVWALFMNAALVVGVTVGGAASGSLYEEVISKDASCRDFFWKGVDVLGNGEFGDADKYLRKAVDRDAKCFLAYILLSQLAYAQNDEKKSTAYLQKVPPEPPELTAMYEDLAALLRADDYERLATQAQYLIAAYPQTMTAVAALHLLARAQYHTGRKEDALRAFKIAYMYSDLAPGTVPAYGSQAELNELETFAGRR